MKTKSCLYNAYPIQWRKRNQMKETKENMTWLEYDLYCNILKVGGVSGKTDPVVEM